METFIKWFLKIKLLARTLCLIMLISIFSSCEKESAPTIDFVFNAKDIISYPEKHISITFDIKPKYDLGNYTIKWYNPDSLSGAGSYKINITKDIILDFEISDNKNTVKRFQYKIMTDTIDSVRYDYRNGYIGKYYCSADYSFGNSKKHYYDTLIVVKNSTFGMLNILTTNDIKKNYEGNKMTYLNSHGYYNSPTGAFSGYHSWALFSNDSIHYTENGPLGFYYTIIYKGIKLKQ